MATGEDMALAKKRNGSGGGDGDEAGRQAGHGPPSLCRKQPGYAGVAAAAAGAACGR